jgi:DNA-binding Lrp family transcriptional regulator
MKAYIMIDIRAGGIHEVVRNLRRLDSVIEANMTFGPYDAIAVVQAGDVNEVGKILANQIQPIPGVIETLTCLALEI